MSFERLAVQIGLVSGFGVLLTRRLPRLFVFSLGFFYEPKFGFISWSFERLAVQIGLVSGFGVLLTRRLPRNYGKYFDDGEHNETGV